MQHWLQARHEKDGAYTEDDTNCGEELMPKGWKHDSVPKDGN